MNKTTKKHFEIFKKECLKWIEFWGMSDFVVNFLHSDDQQDKGKDGACDTLYVSSHCILILCKEWGDRVPLTNREIRATAFHEVGELLISKFAAVGASRYINQDEEEVARHELINRLQNAIFEVDNG